MKVFREPLVHFLLLGGLIFAIHAWRQDRAANAAVSDDGKRIEINAATITRLREGWTRQFQRTPAAEDMRGMIEAHIREEVLCREALAMGLNLDDTIVRRRMAQKMEFLTQDIATASAPDEKDLANFFAQHANNYAKPVRISFCHVYFSKEKRGQKLDSDMKEALDALAKPGASEENFGDAFLQGFEFKEQEEQDLISVFGREFAAAVIKAPLDVWSGPMTSSYGVHLVRVTNRSERQPVELAAVREVVLRDFLDERRRTANDEVFLRMKKNYEIIIDKIALKDATLEPVKTAQSNP